MTRTAHTITIDWKPDRTSPKPMYEQVVAYVTAMVQNGSWVKGDRLPAQRELAKQLGVNRSTVVTAMEELLSYGIIETGGSGGTRIAGGSWSLLLAQPPDWNKYIQSGPFRENKPTIQTINKIEFEPGYIRIGTGEISPKLYPSALVADIFRKMPERILSLNYLGPLGLPELRKAVCERLKWEHDIDAGTDNILISSGSLQALQLISICMLKRGSDVYTEAPTYLRSLQVFQSAGMNMVGLPMDDEGMRFSTLKSENLTNSLIYTIPTFHNPTGTVMSLRRRTSLLTFCRQQSIPLIEDDAYASLWLDKKPPRPIKTMDESGNVLYMGTISKTMAPGLRIGWTVGPEPVIYRLGDVKMQTDYGSSSVSQWVMTELFTGGKYDEYLDGLRQELRARRENALDALEHNFAGAAEWNVPAGGFYIWLRFRDKLPMDKIFKDALAQGVLFNPGNVYDYSENNAIRLSYAYADPEDLRKAVRILAGITEKYLKA